MGGNYSCFLALFRSMVLDHEPKTWINSTSTPISLSSYKTNKQTKTVATIYIFITMYI